MYMNRMYILDKRLVYIMASHLFINNLYLGIIYNTNQEIKIFHRHFIYTFHTMK